MGTQIEKPVISLRDVSSSFCMSSLCLPRCGKIAAGAALVPLPEVRHRGCCLLRRRSLIIWTRTRLPVNASCPGLNRVDNHGKSTAALGRHLRGGGGGAAALVQQALVGTCVTRHLPVSLPVQPRPDWSRAPRCHPPSICPAPALANTSIATRSISPPIYRRHPRPAADGPCRTQDVDDVQDRRRVAGRHGSHSLALKAASQH